jgi:DNA-binding NarL/FixJ family response regulator
MLANYPYPQYRKKCMEAGADFFFDKSSEFDQIVTVCKRVIKNCLS